MFFTTSLKVKLEDPENSISQIVSGWISNNEKVLIAIDAPLGYPAKLGKILTNHEASLTVINFNISSRFFSPNRAIYSSIFSEYDNFH